MLLQEATRGVHPLSGSIAEWVWLIPLLPFAFFAAGHATLAWAVGLTAVSLFTVGALMSLFTGRSAWASGARMLMIGAVAGAVTFGIGHVLGISVS